MATFQSLFANDLITIDIGFRYIKIVQIRKKKNNDLTIVNFGIGDTPRGCIKNGAIKDKERVIAEIKRVMSEHNISAKEAKIVMSGTNIITRIIMIDKVPASEIDTKAWEEIQAYLPINFNDHSVDYKVLGIVNEGNEEKIKIFVTAVAKKIINSYIEIIQSLGLKPVSVDIPANSVAKFFQKDIEHKEPENWARKQKLSKLNSKTFAVIDLGSETTIINILKDKTPEFNRVLLNGSSNIDVAIFKALNLEQNQMDKAERYKKSYGIVRYKDPNNELEWSCSEAAKSVMLDVVRNIKMCIEFYMTKCAGEQLSKVYIIGGGSKLKGIREFFEDTLGIPVYPINSISVEGVEFTSGLDTDRVNFLINAMGIAL
ncbi:MAG: type IV pilus assembly protein PilM [Clostridia bacterium]|nr:type IV pilus assembly protein PilM [Clostridia bacterium]